MAIKARVVCVLCGRVFSGTLQTWPFPQDPAERWRISWHRVVLGDPKADHCPGWWRLDHRRFDEHRQAS